MRNRLIVILSLLLLALTSCKSEFDVAMASNDMDLQYKMAFKMFDEEKYGKAAEMFESLSMLAKGTAQEDTVLYYWGLSNYRFMDYTTAEANLAQFITTFPLSPFSVDAQYLRIMCLYKSTYRYELDQTPTRTALLSMEQFLRDNPDSEHREEVLALQDDLNDRLELKAYKSAYLYYHMEDYLAAHYALKNVLKDNADNRYREDILYYTAMAAYKYAANSVVSKQRERYLTFVDDYLNMVSEYPDSDYSKSLEPLYKKTQKILKKEE